MSAAASPIQSDFDVESLISFGTQTGSAYAAFLKLIGIALKTKKYRNIKPPQASLILNVYLNPKRDNDLMTVSNFLKWGNFTGDRRGYTLQGLLKAGYITSEDASHDKRLTIIKITGKGQQLCKDILAFFESYKKLYPSVGIFLEELKTLSDGNRRLAIALSQLPKLKAAKRSP